MRTKTKSKYNRTTITGFDKILKRCQLPDTYLTSKCCVFAWNDGNGISIIDDDFKVSFKVGTTMDELYWNSIVWPSIERAGSNLTHMLQSNGWKLGKPIEKVYET